MILLMGVSGSGKTTVGKMLAERLGFEFVDADDFHSRENKAKMNRGVPLTDADRLPWLQTISEKVNELLAQGDRIVLACSALTEAYRDILINEKGLVPVLLLEGTQNLFAERLALRTNHFFNRTLLQSQFEKLQKPENCMVLEASKTPEEIVDLACLQLRSFEND